MFENNVYQNLELYCKRFMWKINKRTAEPHDGFTVTVGNESTRKNSRLSVHSAVIVSIREGENFKK